MANEEKLLNLVNVIGEAKDRGEWDQNWWARKTNCGTTMCAAGWQCAIEGHTADFSDLTSARHPDGTVTGSTISGESISEVATRTLELNDEEAHALFYGVDNDYEEFVETVKDIINGEYKYEDA